MHHDYHRRTAVEQEQRSSSRFRFTQTLRNRDRRLHAIRRLNNNTNSNNAPQSFDLFNFYSDEPLIETGNALRDANVRSPNVPSMFRRGRRRTNLFKSANAATKTTTMFVS